MELESFLVLLQSYQTTTTLFTPEATLRVRALVAFKVEKVEGG